MCDCSKIDGHREMEAMCVEVGGAITLREGAKECKDMIAGKDSIYFRVELQHHVVSYLNLKQGPMHADYEIERDINAKASDRNAACKRNAELNSKYWNEEGPPTGAQ